MLIKLLTNETKCFASETPLWNSVLQKYYTETHRENTEEHREEFTWYIQD